MPKASTNEQTRSDAMRKQCQTNCFWHSNRKYFRDCFVDGISSRTDDWRGRTWTQSAGIVSARARFLCVLRSRRPTGRPTWPSRERRRHRQEAQTQTEHAYAHIVLVARYDDATKLLRNFDDYPVFLTPLTPSLPTINHHWHPIKRGSLCCLIWRRYQKVFKRKWDLHQ